MACEAAVDAHHWAPWVRLRRNVSSRPPHVVAVEAFAIANADSGKYRWHLRNPRGAGDGVGLNGDAAAALGQQVPRQANRGHFIVCPIAGRRASGVDVEVCVSVPHKSDVVAGNR